LAINIDLLAHVVCASLAYQPLVPHQRADAAAAAAAAAAEANEGRFDFPSHHAPKWNQSEEMLCTAFVCH
jgi:hypothetical protein